MSDYVSIKNLILEKISGEWGVDPTTDHSVAVIRTTNFTNEGRLNLDKIASRDISDSKIKAKKLFLGDTIIEKSGGSPSQPVGRVVYFNINDGKNYLCNNFTSVLRPSSKVDPKYLFYGLYFLHLTKKTLSYQNKTTGIINLQLDRYLANEKIKILSVDEQKRMVELLDHVSSLRQKRRQAIGLLDEHLKSTFLELFGDTSPDFSSWPAVKLESLIRAGKSSMRTGPFGSDLKHSEFVDSGIAVIGIDNAVHNKFTWEKRRYITDEKYQKLKRYTLYPRDVIITIMATTGKSAVIPDDIPLSINTKHLAAISLDSNKSNPYFISYSIYSDPNIMKQIRGKSRGAIMPGLNLGIIKKLEFNLPPVVLQNRFEEVMQDTESLKQKMIIQAAELENQFLALMQKVFAMN